MKHGLSARISQKTDKLTRMDLAAFISIAAAAVFLILRCQRGFGFCDEHVFLSGVSRLLAGDAMISDEWHVAQLFAFLMLLPFKIFTSITGSVEGIVLYFRYLLIIAKVLTSVALYCSLRKHGIFALLSSLSLLLFLLWLMPAVLHHSIGMLLLTLLVLALLRAKKPGGFRFFFIGVLGACAVLCNPLFAAFAPIYCILAVIYAVRQRRGKEEGKLSGTYFSFRSALPVLLGIAFMATIFFVYLFSHTTLSELIQNIHMIFSDPEHSFSLSEQQTTQSVFNSIINIKKIFLISPFAPAAYAVLSAVILFDKQRLKHRLVYVSVLIAIFFFYVISIFFINPNKTPDGISFAYMYLMMLPLTFMCITCYILTENKDKHLFLCCCVPSIIYTICVDLSSAVGIASSASCIAVIDSFGIILIGNFLKELRVSELSEKKKPDLKKNPNRSIGIVYVFTIGALCTHIVLEAVLISTSFSPLFAEKTFSDGTGENFSVTCQYGPHKGIMTNHTVSQTYYNVMDDLAPAKERGDGLLLSLTTYSWIDLYFGGQIPSLSIQSFPFTELWFENYDFVDRLLQYYELHPDKYPKYIYVLHSFFGIEIEGYTALLAEGPDLLAELAKEYNFTFEIEKLKEGYLIEITYL